MQKSTGILIKVGVCVGVGESRAKKQAKSSQETADNFVFK